MTARSNSAEETRNETTPLLHEHRQDEDNSTPPVLPHWTHKQWRVMIVGAILMLTVDFGGYLGAPPQIKIFEDVICRNYYFNLNQTMPSGTAVQRLDDQRCKAEAVQSELALVNGWKDTFDYLPGIALGLPYGVLADHVGRRPILMLSVLGVILGEIWPRIVCGFGLPLRLVWLSGLTRVVGGGELVASSIVLTIVADIFSEEERATALFRLSSTALMAEIVATPISALMMSDPWRPYLLGLVISIVFALVAYFIPETIEEAREKTRKALNAEDEDISEAPTGPLKKTFLATVSGKAWEFIESTRFIWGNINVLFSLLVLFVSTLSKQSTNLLLQYASAKYHWSIARASFLISLRGSVSIATFLLLVPAASSFLVRYLHFEAVRKDIWITQASALCCMVGFFVIFVAQTPAVLLVGVVVMSLGIPFNLSALSVATSLVLSDHIATLYAAGSVMNSVGAVLAGPIFAEVYGFGMRHGVEWSGLPFGLASATFVLAFITVACIRTARRPESVTHSTDSVI